MRSLTIEVPSSGQNYRFGIEGDTVTLDELEMQAEYSIQDLRAGLDAKHRLPDNRGLDVVASSLKSHSYTVVEATGVVSPRQASVLLARNVHLSRSSTAPHLRNLRANGLSAVDAQYCGTWRPNFHSNTALPSAFAGNRYDTLAFAFTSGQLNAFACTQSTTFEPDLVTYNYDGAYYLGDEVTWTSNMPGAYFDTNLFDAPTERVYTVGARDVSLLLPYTEYTNYVRTTFGNSNTDTAKVVWQRGHEAFQGCNLLTLFFHPEWCTFADDSKKEFAWLISLPGTWTP